MIVMVMAAVENMNRTCRCPPKSLKVSVQHSIYSSGPFCITLCKLNGVANKKHSHFLTYFSEINLLNGLLEMKH